MRAPSVRYQVGSLAALFWTIFLFVQAPTFANETTARDKILLQSLATHVSPDATFQEVKKQLEHTFLKNSRMNFTIDLELVLAKNRLQAAQARSNLISSWLRFDLNADSDISYDEIRQYLSVNTEITDLKTTNTTEIIEQFYLKSGIPDYNNNNITTLEEMLSEAKLRYPPLGHHSLSNSRFYIDSQIDTNKDGLVDLNEYIAAFTDILTEIDYNGNGIIGEKEFEQMLDNL